jgi:serine/threonine protein kinase
MVEQAKSKTKQVPKKSSQSTERIARYDKAWFIQSKQGNIKDEYFFEKKLGSGGYGAVYLARSKQTGVPVAVKAMQKGKISDYEAFRNEIKILMQLVSKNSEPVTHKGPSKHHQTPRDLGD